jgi:hypothetical protein
VPTTITSVRLCESAADAGDVTIDIRGEATSTAPNLTPPGLQSAASAERFISDPNQVIANSRIEVVEAIGG